MKLKVWLYLLILEKYSRFVFQLPSILSMYFQLTELWFFRLLQTNRNKVQVASHSRQMECFSSSEVVKYLEKGIFFTTTPGECYKSEIVKNNYYLLGI